MTCRLELKWWRESADVGPMGGSGCNVRMLTSAPALSTNIYCEQPYCCADGTRLAITRLYQLGPDAAAELLVYDIPRYNLALLERNVSAVANCGWTGLLFVLVGSGDDARLVRFDINTLTRAELFRLSDVPDLPATGFQAISPDGRFGLARTRVNSGAFGILRVNLETGAAQVIHQSPNIFNPHQQYSRHRAGRILVQENRGAVVDELGNIIRPFDERGVGLYSIAADGSDRKDFPVGPPLTANTTGHEVWISDTDRVLVTVSDFYDDGTGRGTLLEVSHDADKPRLVSHAPMRWNHISASRCGRFFVTDSYDLPTRPIIVGSIRTGKWQVLCETSATGGGAQYMHVHPYMTSDNRHVVFNTDRTGLAQVYLADVDPDWLEALDC